MLGGEPGGDELFADFASIEVVGHSGIDRGVRPHVLTGSIAFFRGSRRRSDRFATKISGSIRQDAVCDALRWAKVCEGDMLNRRDRLGNWLLSGLMVAGLLLGWGSPAIAADYNRRVMEGADFAGQDLRESSFTKAGLRETNFAGANLTGVSFFAANLERSNLTGANLTNSTLDSANLTSANLTNANLEGAFAFNAKFSGAIVDGADFTDTQMREDTRVMLCKTAQGVNSVSKRATRETLFCDE